MKELISENYNCYNNDYSGFDYINELDKVEKRTDFAINIVNFKKNGKIQYIIKFDYNDTKTLQYLNLYQNHFSYITNCKKLSKIFTCSKCGYKASYPSRINMHVCIKETVDYFEKYNILWEKSKNTVVELNDYYEFDVDFKYDYIATYDLEAIWLKTNIETESSKLKFVTRHVPVSCSVASNIPGYEEAICVISENPGQLCRNIFEYFDKLQKAASYLMFDKYMEMLSHLNKKMAINLEITYVRYQ